MDDDHMFRWELENNEDDAPWTRWCDKLEELVGHDMDGSQTEDGYSLDWAYEMYRGGLTPEAAKARVDHEKAILHRLRWGNEHPYAHNCHCCGDIVFGDEPLCDLCNLAGCEPTKAADGEWDYWNCQREDIDDDDGAWWDGQRVSGSYIGSW